MPRPSAPGTLSDAELRALRAYLAAGTYKGAAHRLGVATTTIRNHLASARERMGVDNTAQLVAILGLRL